MKIKALTELIESTFFSANIEPSWHFTVQMAIEIHHFNFEIGKRENFPVFFKMGGWVYREGVEVKKRKREQERQFPLAGSASKCSAVGQKGPRVIIDPPSMPDSPCPKA